MSIKATLSWIFGDANAFYTLDFMNNFILIPLEVIPYYSIGTVIALGIADTVNKHDETEEVHAPYIYKCLQLFLFFSKN